MNRFVNIAGVTINRDLIVSIETKISPVKDSFNFSLTTDESYQDFEVYKVIHFGISNIEEYCCRTTIKARGHKSISEMADIYKKEHEPKIIKKILEEIYEDK